MAIIALDKNDHGVLVSHAQDDGHEYPVIQCKLEFQVDGDNFVPVLTFCPVIDENKDEESQRRLADKLKTLVIDSVKLPLRFQWDPNGDLMALVVKDGKRYIVPLPKKVEIIVPGDKPV